MKSRRQRKIIRVRKPGRARREFQDIASDRRRVPDPILRCRPLVVGAAAVPGPRRNHVQEHVIAIASFVSDHERVLKFVEGGTLRQSVKGADDRVSPVVVDQQKV